MGTLYNKECLDNLLQEVLDIEENSPTSKTEEKVTEKLVRALSYSKMLIDALDRYWAEFSPMTDKDLEDEFDRIVNEYNQLTNQTTRKDKNVLI